MRLIDVTFSASSQRGLALRLTGVGAKPVKEGQDHDPQTKEKKYDGHLHPVACAVLLFLLNYLSPAGGRLLAGAGALICGATLYRPVEDIIILEALTNKEVTEELAKVGIIRLVVEAKSTSVVQKDAKFARKATAEDISGCRHLLFHDPVVLLLLGSGLESLPRKGATQEVHQHIRERFKVITTGLLNTQMSVDGGVASGTGQVLILPVWDV